MRVRSRFGLVAALLFAFVLGLASTAGAQQFELLSSFAGCPPEGCGPAGDAAKPREPLVVGPDGNFYGTSPIDLGSNVGAPRGWGTVFRVSPDGARTVLHHFPGTGPGGCGSASVTFGADGRLYGVGTRCGSAGSDTIYRLDGASFEVLQEFPAGLGLRPSTIVAAPNGAFYGVGVQGPLPVIYKWNGAAAVPVRTAPNGFTSFSASLIPGPDGNLYFTELLHVEFPFEVLRYGSVLRLTQNDHFETVHDFQSATLRAGPDHDLILGPDGALYGNEAEWVDRTVQRRLYRLTLNGVFAYLTDSGVGPPIGIGSDGSVYLRRGLGGNYGGIARLLPDGTGTVVSVIEFSEVDGSGWVGGLTRGRDGNFYGTTAEGGEHGLGVFFRIRLPRVDMKANGTDGPIEVGNGAALQISMAFDAASDAVSPSELYLAVVTPALQVIWTTPSGFSLTPAPIYSGPLPSFPLTSLINIPDAAVLPPGDYYWVAIVDADANGVPNGHYVDFVKTTKIIK